MTTAFYDVANNIQDFLNGSINNSTVSIVVTDISSFPIPVNGYPATIWDSVVYPDPGLDSGREMVFVTGVNVGTKTLTVTRNFDGRGAATHNSGAAIRGLVTKQHLSQVYTAVNTLESLVGPTSVGAFPDWYIYDGSRDRNVADINSAISGIDLGYTFSDNNFPTMCGLDSTRVLLVYKDNTLGWRAAVGTYDSTTLQVMFGTPFTLSAQIPSGATCARVVKINTDKAIVCWGYGGGPTGVFAAVITTSGTTVSAIGSSVQVTSDFGGPALAAICQIDTDKAVIGFYESSVWKARCLSVSSTTITQGTVQGISGAAPQGTCIAQLDTGKFITVWGHSSSVQSIAGSVSGTTISLGGQTQIEAATVGNTDLRVIVLSNSEAIVWNGTTSYLAAFKITISGTTITLTGGGGGMSGSSGFGTAVAAVTASAALLHNGSRAWVMRNGLTSQTSGVPLCITEFTTLADPNAQQFSQSACSFAKLDSSNYLLLYGNSSRSLKLRVVRL